MAEHIHGLMLDYKDLEDLRVLSCPLQVGDKMWIVHRPAGQESEVSPSEASEKSIAEETLSTHSQHSGIFLEIGTIAEVGDETIIISLHSGGSKIRNLYNAKLMYTTTWYNLSYRRKNDCSTM